MAAAGRAFALWQHSSCEERRSLLEAIAARIEQNAPELAEIIVREQGKPLALAHVEVGGAVAWSAPPLRWNCRSSSSRTAPANASSCTAARSAWSGSITPWNWPLMIAVWHIMPALRAGTPW